MGVPGRKRVRQASHHNNTMSTTNDTTTTTTTASTLTLAQLQDYAKEAADELLSKIGNTPGWEPYECSLKDELIVRTTDNLKYFYHIEAGEIPSFDAMWDTPEMAEVIAAFEQSATDAGYVWEHDGEFRR